LSQEEKLYDAVLIANPLPVKRAELAAKVENLAIFTNIPYGKLRAQIPHAFYAERASPEQVRKIISQSRVGLCLSRYEGACYASSEYILCGVPVVTTDCRGGREVWYERDNHITAKARPESVARAVRELSSRSLDASFIRQAHIEKSNVFRRRFVELTQALCEEYGEKCDCDELLRTQFRHKMGGYRPVSELLDEMATV
jgi:glycosyltransferase involved in cell wall biosynthesis